MKKLILLLIMGITLFTEVQASEQSFEDMENHWAKEAVTRMVTNGIVQGYSDNTFRPEQEVTVLEFIKMMIETFHLPIEEEGLQKWPNYYIATAQKYSLPSNYEEKLTRYEMAEILSQLLTLPTTKKVKNDWKDVDASHKNMVAQLGQLQIVQGYEDHTFRGEQLLTRAEAVVIALRAEKARQQKIQQQHYPINSCYTNIGLEEASQSKIDKIRFEIKNQQIHFYDNGRFSHVQDYVIDEKYVTNQKIITLIQKLVSEGSYTTVYYVPSPYIIHQIIIKYSLNEQMASQGADYFSFTYYEDKRFDLNRATRVEAFSKECYMKITLTQLWKELYEYQQGEYLEEG